MLSDRAVERSLTSSGGAPALAARRRPRRARWAVTAGAALVAAAGFGLGFLLFDSVLMPRLLGHGDEVAVPDIVGRTLAAARSMLEEEGLAAGAIEEGWSGVYPDGYVIAQAPPALSQVKRGREVKLTVSIGREGQEVPDLVGAGYREAQVALARAGLRVGRLAYSYSPAVAKDAVAATDPEPRTQVEPGSRIDLLVSLGPRPDTYLLPDLRGRPVEEVRAFFARAGIRVVERPRESHGAPPGQVLEQAPAAGHRIRSGELLEVVVASPGRGGWR